jgi:tRNA-specific 2-thiouridylase
MSGGVDSSVAAWLLQQQGYEVFGIFMHTWDAGDEAGAGAPVCTAERDLADAQAVADQLRIPLLQLDVVQSYWTQVFEGFLAGLEAGLTPNPDLACNSAIKFGVLLEYAQQQGSDVLATGHYARTRGGSLQQQQQGVQEVLGAAQQQQGEGAGVQLLCGVDADKDQTYFLASLGQQHLAAAAFPVGEWGGHPGGPHRGGGAAQWMSKRGAQDVTACASPQLRGSAWGVCRCPVTACMCLQ